MKVLYAITQAVRGGAQENVRALIEHGIKHGDVGLVTGGDGPLIEEAQSYGAKVWVLPNLVRPIHPLKDTLVVRDLIQVIREFQPDLIHAHSSKAGIVARIAARMTKTPAVFSAHGWAFTPGVPPARQYMALAAEYMVGKFTSHIICGSNYDGKTGLRKKIIDTDKLSVVWYGVPDVPHIAPHQPREKVKVVCVSRLAPPKDHATLIRAAAMIESGYELLIVGEGELKPYMEALAESLGTRDRIRFLGNVPDIVSILADSDIFVFSSTHEGLPYCIMEAMRAGLPVIATNAGGIGEEVLDGVNGYLLPCCDVDAMAKSIRTLISNRDMRIQMGTESRRLYLERFALSRMIDGTFSIYNKVLSR